MYTNMKLSGSYELSEKEYLRIRDIVYANAGISLGDNKRELVHARLSKVMRKRGIAGFSEYIRMLESDGTGNELVSLMDAISTNVTHFFREKQHFDFMNEAIQSESRFCDLRIWSAGCSSGEEPYSMAISMLERFTEKCATPPRILATDLSTKVLKKAVDGIFPAKSVEHLDRMLLRKYFLKGKKSASDLVKVKPEVKSMVTFKRLNFIEPFKLPDQYDFIFCRNVMIYFDNPTRERLVARFTEHLKPGSYLMIGHSESLNGISHTLQYVKPTIYRKK